MDFNEFLSARQSRWQRLGDLLEHIESHTLAGLSPAEADEFFALYRLVSSDLNLVQTRTANPALLEYLERLVGRAYAILSVPRRSRPLRWWWQTLRHRFPARVRAESRLLALTSTVMVAGMALGFVATLLSNEAAEVFLPPEHLVQSPRERVAMLEDNELAGEQQIQTAGQHTYFSTFLFTHNIRVTVLCFALGFTLGVGTVVLLFFNGAVLGSLAALYLLDGVMTFFVAWVGPHGSIELPCILFGGTAGLMIARAQFRRDAGTTWAQIRRMRPALVDILVGTATLLVLAGVIEGGFSQINEPTMPYPFKIAVAAALFAALLAYLFWMPVRPLSGAAGSEPVLQLDAGRPVAGGAGLTATAAS